MIKSFICFLIAQTIGWYAFNSQFVWEFWRDRPILAMVGLGLPSSLFFWLGSKYCVEATGALWTSKFLSFAVGNFIFAILTWYHMSESVMSVKTGACLLLAFAIILIQIFVK